METPGRGQQRARMTATPLLRVVVVPGQVADLESVSFNGVTSG